MRAGLLLVEHLLFLGISQVLSALLPPLHEPCHQMASSWTERAIVWSNRFGAWKWFLDHASRFSSSVGAGGVFALCQAPCCLVGLQRIIGARKG